MNINAYIAASLNRFLKRQMTHLYDWFDSKTVKQDTESLYLDALIPGTIVLDLPAPWPLTSSDDLNDKRFELFTEDCERVEGRCIEINIDRYLESLGKTLPEVRKDYPDELPNRVEEIKEWINWLRKEADKLEATLKQ